MAGPRLVDADYSRSTSADTEVMVVLDVSRSMTARDVAPNRLERARLELENLISRTAHARIGLMVYAARPHLVTPPTVDKSVLLHDLQIPRSGLLPTEGSGLVAVITFAARNFHAKKGARVLLLVSDGEILSKAPGGESLLQAEVTRLVKEGIVFYALGVGSTAGSPLLDASGDWLRDQSGPVVSRLHEARLQTIARTGQGRYARVTDSDAEWRKLYDHGIRQLYLAHGENKDTDLIEWQELYAWFLLPAMLLLLSNLQLQRNILPGHEGVVFAVFIVLSLASPWKARADNNPAWQEHAYRAYVSESYLEAGKAYARVGGYPGRMGEGSSAYRLGKFVLAMQLFTQAILDADSDQQRARAIFNLANSHYKLGDYEKAAVLYAEVLRYDPDNPAARSNRKLALAMQKQQREDGNESTKRQGRGPRSARLAEGETISDGKLSLGDEEKAEDLPANRSLSQSELIENPRLPTGRLRASMMPTGSTRTSRQQPSSCRSMQWRWMRTGCGSACSKGKSISPHPLKCLIRSPVYRHGEDRLSVDDRHVLAFPGFPGPGRQRYCPVPQGGRSRVRQAAAADIQIRLFSTRPRHHRPFTT
ncbi:vWA domain-containing protein [Thiolapillus sp.]|uniref:vWA domain-containing protein n=1 Tax=Thiolapillus sp. TaxID=2017437 RepID=UPI003AF81A2B